LLFSSNIFLHLFLPLLLGVYFLVPRSWRNLVLLVASLFFYAWGEPELVLVMLASTAINYRLGRWIGRTRGTPKGRRILAIGIAANLGLLAYFKYAAFIVETINPAWSGLFGSALGVPEIDLPIGISFYTFQAMAYLIDVARGDTEAEQNPINLSLYIAMFPQLIAGPIVRYTQVADRLHDRTESVDQFAEGVRRFIIGLGKKVLIANSVATAADAIFNIPDSSLTFVVAWLGLACYTLQIYFAFSGYSDMAIGLGRMFGFKFLENFRYPYTAQSISEFWRRWHISLSSWFRDYLYIPLGGNRCSALRTSCNLVIVFLLCGLWHGASMNFVIWGLFHGALLMFEGYGLSQWVSRCWRPLRHAYLIVAVMLGWVVFRAEDLSHSISYYQALAGLNGWSDAKYNIWLYWDSGLAIAFACGIAGSLPLLPWIRQSWESLPSPDGQPTRIRLWNAGLRLTSTPALLAVLVASLAALAAGTYNPFIYFRF
jgi:alginate O-acetyltransferase complex protein AlgI